MIKGIEHVAICAKDTRALAEWYIRVFGMELVYDNGKGTYFVAAPDGSMMEIISAGEDKGLCSMTDSGIRHFALSVAAEEFDEMVLKIKAEGVEILSEPSEKNGIKLFFFRDIEGNIFHLIYRSEPLV